VLWYLCLERDGLVGLVKINIGWHVGIEYFSTNDILVLDYLLHFDLFIHIDCHLTNRLTLL
jgi:hypothetical protein